VVHPTAVDLDVFHPGDRPGAGRGPALWASPPRRTDRGRSRRSKSPAAECTPNHRGCGSGDKTAGGGVSWWPPGPSVSGFWGLTPRRARPSSPMTSGITARVTLPWPPQFPPANLATFVSQAREFWLRCPSIRSNSGLSPSRPVPAAPGGRGRGRRLAVCRCATVSPPAPLVSA